MDRPVSGGPTGQAQGLRPAIGPTHAMNWVMGICPILFAGLSFPRSSIGALIGLWGWPDVFFLFALLAVVFVVLGLRLIFFSKPWTSTLHFQLRKESLDSGKGGSCADRKRSVGGWMRISYNQYYVIYCIWRGMTGLEQCIALEDPQHPLCR
jgi:hypothetical protein